MSSVAAVLPLTDKLSEKRPTELRKLRPDELLIQEGTLQQSLFLIQKGKVRLYCPKGKGYVELGFLGPGELITDREDLDFSSTTALPKSKKNWSFYAQAIGEAEILEISFDGFQKFLEQTPPMIKLLFQSLLSKVHQQLQKIKELGQNSLSYSEGDYCYLKDHEVLKMLTCMYFLSHKATAVPWQFPKEQLKTYGVQIFGLSEVKLESLLFLLRDFGSLELPLEEKTKEPQVRLTRPDEIKQLMLFYQTERFLPDDKKLSVSPKCLQLLEKIAQHLKTEPLIPALPSKVEGVINFPRVVISEILDFFKERNMNIYIDDLDDARRCGITKEKLINQQQKIELEISIEKFQYCLPLLRFQQALKKLNDQKK